MDWVSFYDTVSKIGFPALFVFGLVKEWWVMGQTYRLLLDNLAANTKEISAQSAELARVADLHERSIAVSERQVGIIASQQGTIEHLTERLARVEARLAITQGG